MLTYPVVLLLEKELHRAFYAGEIEYLEYHNALEHIRNDQRKKELLIED
jgi:hypothetical protein